ncbi:MAG: hypothetical protein K1X29_08260 [Bdellovibrionales bacterium]|nr:hypothetical protein [Bdellovibrionales bacterium]
MMRSYFFLSRNYTLVLFLLTFLKFPFCFANPLLERNKTVEVNKKNQTSELSFEELKVQYLRQYAWPSRNKERNEVFFISREKSTSSPGASPPTSVQPSQNLAPTMTHPGTSTGGSSPPAPIPSPPPQQINLDNQEEGN